MKRVKSKQKMSFRWVLVVIVLLPLLFLALNYLRTRIRDAFRAVRLRTSRSNSYLAENLNGMRTVQLFNREARRQVLAFIANGRFVHEG